MFWIKDVIRVLAGQNPARYLRSALWLTTAKVTSMLVSLIATFYVARVLGPQNFGELSYAQSVIGILAVLGGLTGVLYRDIVAKKEPEGLLLGTAWVVSFASSLTTAILVATYVFIVSHDTLTIWVIGILLISQFLNPFYIINNVFYAKTETKWLAFAQLLIHVLISGTKITAMIFGQGVLVLATIFVFEHILTALVLSVLYLFLHKGSFFSWGFKLTYAKKMVFDSLPIVIISVSGMISGRVDQVLLRNIVDITTVGFYSVAVQLSEVWQFIPGLILTALFPAIANARNNRTIYGRRLVALGGSFFVFGIVVSFFTTLLAPFVVPLIYGQAFTSSVALLQVYIWSSTGMMLGFLISSFLAVENLRRVQIVTGVIPMLLNVLLNIILIPVSGALGAALATTISYSLLPIIPFFFPSVRRVILAK